jgi:inhibitor of cysteine peptidase
MRKEKTFIALAFVVGIFVASLIFGIFSFNGSLGVEIVTWENEGEKVVDTQFDSYNDLIAFLKQKSGSSQANLQNSFARGLGEGMIADSMEMTTTTGAVAKSAAPVASEFSQTNIQVEGVDEPDIVKNDGKYIYSVSDNKVVITEAYPASGLRILGEIDYYSGERDYEEGYSSDTVRNLFVNGDNLVVFLNSYVYETYSQVRCLGMDYCGGESASFSLVEIYDISDKENPELIRSISTDGDYKDARMIGDFVYFVSSKYVNLNNPILPIYRIDGVEFETPLDRLYYLGDEDENYVFSSVSSINLEDGEFNNEVYLIGYTTTLYASENNIYLTSTEYMDHDEYQTKIIENAVLPILPGSVKSEVGDILVNDDYMYNKFNRIGKLVDEYVNSLDDVEKEEFGENLLSSIYDYKLEIEKERVTTNIYKISIDEGDISHEASGSVPGRVLNQFSMDEYEDNFRIATTTGGWFWWGGTRANQTNGVYVLDEDLENLGSVDGLASGETIHSARFMGDRLYLVTFRRVDPLFFIDLSSPTNPSVLGYLKITGVSEYLHPYDENHIIGVGQDANDEGGMGGLKISLFDVSDVTNPVEKAKFLIGGRGTSSPILNDHKAFLFDKNKNLMVIPVSESQNDYSNYWYGAYVLNIDSNDISLRGKITHHDQVSGENKRYWQNYRQTIQRSLYMDDVLYTVSQAKIKANEINSLSEIKEVVFSYREGSEPTYYY